MHYLGLINHDTLGLPGMRCRDVTPIFADARAFKALLQDLCAPFGSSGIDLVVGLDALGFVLATGVALQLGVGLAPIRKRGKLPVATDAVEVGKRGDVFELARGALGPKQRVLLVDDWIHSGRHITAALKLVERQGAGVVGITALNIDKNDVTRPLLARYFVHTVMRDGTPLRNDAKALMEVTP